MSPGLTHTALVPNLYRKQTLMEGRDYFLDDDGREDGLLAVAECLIRRFERRADTDNSDWASKLGDAGCPDSSGTDVCDEPDFFERWEAFIREPLFEHNCADEELSAVDAQKILEEAAMLAEEKLRDSPGFPAGDLGESESEDEEP
jgi:hypothetical protein